MAIYIHSIWSKNLISQRLRGIICKTLYFLIENEISFKFSLGSLLPGEMSKAVLKFEDETVF